VNIELITEDELNAELEAAYKTLPQRIGFCIGIPGQACGRPIFDNEDDAVELETDWRTGKKQGILGGCCWGKLFPLVGKPPSPMTASQMVAQKRRAGKISAKIPENRVRLRGSKERRRNNRTSGNSVNIALPGSLDFPDRKGGRPKGAASMHKEKPGPTEWRNYPDAK